jgi:hypothetical protein
LCIYSCRYCLRFLHPPTHFSFQFLFVDNVEHEHKGSRCTCSIRGDLARTEEQSRSTAARGCRARTAARGSRAKSIRSLRGGVCSVLVVGNAKHQLRIIVIWDVNRGRYTTTLRHNPADSNLHSYCLLESLISQSTHFHVI